MKKIEYKYPSIEVAGTKISIRWVSYPVVSKASICQHQKMSKRSPLYSGHPVLTDLGQAVREARLNVKLSQEGLADQAQLDRSYMGGIERGEHNLSVMNLKRVADALGMQPSELLEKAGH